MVGNQPSIAQWNLHVGTKHSRPLGRRRPASTSIYSSAPRRRRKSPAQKQNRQGMPSSPSWNFPLNWRQAPAIPRLRPCLTTSPDGRQAHYCFAAGLWLMEALPLVGGSFYLEYLGNSCHSYPIKQPFISDEEALYNNKIVCLASHEDHRTLALTAQPILLDGTRKGSLSRGTHNTDNCRCKSWHLIWYIVILNDCRPSESPGSVSSFSMSTWRRERGKRKSIEERSWRRRKLPSRPSWKLIRASG